MKVGGNWLSKRAAADPADNVGARDGGRGEGNAIGKEVINIDSSSESDRKPAAKNVNSEVVALDSSSSDASMRDNTNRGRKEDQVATADVVRRDTSAAKSQGKQGKRQKRTKSENSKKKTKHERSFAADPQDPFASAGGRVEFVVRGKPRPQYRDRAGWNLTRYNPSKRLQKEFRLVAVEQCLNHVDSVPHLGSNASVSIFIQFRFPPPKTGKIKNTADIDNLCKFILDACNETFYGDDGQIVRLVADKGYDDAHGGEGYTQVTIEPAGDSQ